MQHAQIFIHLPHKSLRKSGPRMEIRMLGKNSFGIICECKMKKAMKE